MKSISIYQSQDEAKLAFEVHQNAEISEIRLAKAMMQSREIDDLAKMPIEVRFDYRCEPIGAFSNPLQLAISFELIGVDASAGKTNGPRGGQDGEAFRIECTYHVRYDVSKTFTISPDHVSAFKNGNAIFNTWPYFREYLQDSMQRMGLPPVIAPFLRLRVKSKAVSPARRAKKS